MANYKNSHSKPGKKPAAAIPARAPLPPAPPARPTSAGQTYASATNTLRTQTVESKPSRDGSDSTSQAVREAAYFLWRERGGNEVVNWLEAERLVLANGSEKRKSR